MLFPFCLALHFLLPLCSSKSQFPSGHPCEALEIYFVRIQFINDPAEALLPCVLPTAP